jgi:hypothetical protein
MSCMRSYPWSEHLPGQARIYALLVLEIVIVSDFEARFTTRLGVFNHLSNVDLVAIATCSILPRRCGRLRPSVDDK